MKDLRSVIIIEYKSSIEELLKELSVAYRCVNMPTKQDILVTYNISDVNSDILSTELAESDIAWKSMKLIYGKESNDYCSEEDCSWQSGGEYNHTIDNYPVIISLLDQKYHMDIQSSAVKLLSSICECYKVVKDAEYFQKSMNIFVREAKFIVQDAVQ